MSEGLTVRFLLASLLAFRFCHTGVQAVTYQVPGDFLTIQTAIDSSVGGDEIVVASGTYFDHIDFGGKNLTLRSTDPEDAGIVQGTILDGSLSGTVVTFSGAESAQCLLAGFTIRNGSGPVGGVRGNDTRATIRNNRIHSNRGGTGGLSQCDGLIEANEVFDNLGLGGGGFHDCDGTIRRNLVYHNTADGSLISVPRAGRGGGFTQCDGLIRNNVVYQNGSDGLGGGFDNCSASILHNTIYDNFAFEGDGLVICNGTIAGNILWHPFGEDVVNSSEPRYCIVSDPALENEGEGNLFTDPRLVSPSGLDFHLRPDSPCIDAGSLFAFPPDDDLEGNPRPFDATSVPRGDGSDYDLGAYEFIGEADPNPSPDQPENVSPEEGVTVVGFNPTLVSSPFSDDDPNDTHTRSEWQVSASSEFVSSNLVSAFKSDGSRLTQVTALPGSQKLPPASPYWWRLRHQDSYAGWSDWSIATSFLTRGSGTLLVPQEFATIQRALDLAISGDTVVVASGTYEEALIFRVDDVTLRSVDPKDPAVVAATILDGPSFPWETIDLQAEGIRIAGLTIQGAQEGIQLHFERSPIIEDCVITSGKIVQLHDNGVIRNCKITVEGGLENCHGLIQGNEITNGRGIFSSLIVPCNAWVIDNLITEIGVGISRCRGNIEGNTMVFNSRAISSCDGLIRNNIIAYNSSQLGCGLANCHGIIEENLIYGNTAVIIPPADSSQTGGAGLLNCNGIVRNNLIFGNYSEARGGGLVRCSGIVVNNTVFGNRAEENGGGMFNCHGRIQNNIIWGNEAPSGAQIDDSTDPSFSCIQDWSGGGVGNLASDPRFVDSENGDFRLLPESPCIDAGAFVEDLLTDFWGDIRPLDATLEPRGDGSDYDIGADEFSISFNLSSDVHKDLQINFLDLFTFSTGWQVNPHVEDPRDIDFNDEINSLDLLILVGDWGQGTGPN